MDRKHPHVVKSWAILASVCKQFMAATGLIGGWTGKWYWQVNSAIKFKLKGELWCFKVIVQISWRNDMQWNGGNIVSYSSWYKWCTEQQMKDAVFILNISIKQLKTSITLCNCFNQGEHDFNVRVITLYQTFLGLCNRGNTVLSSSNAVEIFAGLYLLWYPLVKNNIPSNLQKHAVLLFITHCNKVSNVKQMSARLNTLQKMGEKWLTASQYISTNFCTVSRIVK